MLTPRARCLLEAMAASFAVTAAVSVVSATLPDRHVATAVGFVFLAATWLLVWRHDDITVVRFGVSFGGLVLPGRLDRRRLVRATVRALGWAAVFAAVAFLPFYLGWKMWWRPHAEFSLALDPLEATGEAVGQIVIIALPEEAFYRGYLQTRLDDALPPRVWIGRAAVGPGIVLGSIVFALGHLATIRDPTRLAVFFPSLLFGWLRARTGGIGAAVAFHAACNVFSELLGRAYAVY
jgi:membrane protease YdiL (CAAX protease family)